ncbi:MAG: acyl-CoA dehydrogenase [Pseudomonadales bacterium]|nr:acyl-CoA dehydrogenase [Pseudomonadales bacterium]
MDFSLTEEQTLLKDSVAKFIQNDYGYEDRQKLIKTESGYSADNWRTFAELGWLCVPFSEGDGGIGGGPIETMILMEEFGKGLVVEPFFETVVLSGSVLSRAASPEQKAELIGGIIEGTQVIATAFAEPESRFDLNHVATTATANGDSHSLSGKKSFVLQGGNASTLVVAARTSGDTRDEAGISLFIVDPSASGVSIESAKTLDGHSAADITLDNAPGTLLGAEGEGLSVLKAARDESILALASEAVGMMEKLYKDTVAYTKDRKQFGMPISVFQALQHRMVDMFTAHEMVKSLLLRAVLSYVNNDGEADKNIAALKYYLQVNGQAVAHEAVQIHGGMGMTDEMSTGMYLKRINVINTLFGNGDYHLKQFTALAS